MTDPDPNPRPVPQYQKLSPPLGEAASRELLDFWQHHFAESFAHLGPVVAGAENAFNADTFYVARRDRQLAATCRLTICRANPALALLGEVATAETFRGHGIARHLCAQALGDFLDAGGRALFLATSNPIAAKLYRSLGWRSLPNTRIMVHTAQGAALEAVMPSSAGAALVKPADPGARVPMVPLLAAPHPWRILDANAGMYSTRDYLQESCEGLYTRYEALRETGLAQWFVAQTAPGRLVGLATALFDRPGGRCRVDGFADIERTDIFSNLIMSAVDWARRHGAAAIETHVLNDDPTKAAAFTQAGFLEAGKTTVEVHGQQHPAVRLVIDPHATDRSNASD